MNGWKNFMETAAAIREVGAAMVNQLKNPGSRPSEARGLVLLQFPAPDDYAPGIPFATLELTPNGNENWAHFPAAAVEVTRRLFSGLHVLTAVRALPTTGRKKSEFYPLHSMEEAFLHTYAEILRLHGLGDGVYYEAPGAIITASCGADIPLSTMVFSGDYGIAMNYHTYGFAARPAAGDMAQARRIIDTSPHVLHLEYSRYPDTLEIHINTELFPLPQCLADIQDVCAAGSIPLEIDPVLRSTIC